MGFTTLQDTPITIDLVAQAKTTGWTVDGTSATHEACNAGSIFLTGQTIITGHTYEISYLIVSISGGGVQPFAGTTAGTNRTTPQFVASEMIVAAGTNPMFRFFSDANAVITIFNIRDTEQSTSLKMTNTMAWSESLNKWQGWRTFTVDVAFSLFINLYSFKGGRSWIHRQGSTSRNNFFGTQFQSIIKFVANDNAAQTKTFQSLSIQSNKLMITTTDGIQSSLGQLSELIQSDFLKAHLDDGVTQVDVYSVEGVYSSSFLRDKNSPGGIINGDVIKGNFLTVELITVDNTLLKLLITGVNSTESHIGSR